MKKLGLLFGFMFGMIIFANAQSTPVADQRQKQQVVRIADGVQSGELTRHERKELMRQQRHINRKEHRAKADGVVTPAEKASINRSQRRANRNIYIQKHDAQSR